MTALMAEDTIVSQFPHQQEYSKEAEVIESRAPWRKSISCKRQASAPGKSHLRILGISILEGIYCVCSCTSKAACDRVVAGTTTWGWGGGSCCIDIFTVASRIYISATLPDLTQRATNNFSRCMKKKETSGRELPPPLRCKMTSWFLHRGSSHKPHQAQSPGVACRGAQIHY